MGVPSPFGRSGDLHSTHAALVHDTVIVMLLKQSDSVYVLVIQHELQQTQCQAWSIFLHVQDVWLNVCQPTCLRLILLVVGSFTSLIHAAFV